jgi:hypothetical protein
VRRVRTGFGIFLVLLGCLLAAPAVAAYALAGEVTSQERYLEAVTPLAEDPAIKQTVTTQLTDAVSGNLPESARPLVQQSIAGFVASPDFKRLWVEVNKEAHPQVLAMLRGEQGGGVEIQGDAIVLNLGPIAADVKQRMVAEGVPLADQIPEVDASVQLLSRDSVSQIVPAFDLLEKLSVVLPILVIVLLLGGIALAERRGRALMVGGIGLVVMMLLLVLFQALARSEVTARAPDQELAGSFYDALTSQIMTMAWIICAVGGVAIIAGGFIAAAQAKAAARAPAYDAPRRRSYPR